MESRESGLDARLQSGCTASSHPLPKKRLKLTEFQIILAKQSPSMFYLVEFLQFRIQFFKSFLRTNVSSDLDDFVQVPFESKVFRKFTFLFTTSSFTFTWSA